MLLLTCKALSDLAKESVDDLLTCNQPPHLLTRYQFTRSLEGNKIISIFHVNPVTLELRFFKQCCGYIQINIFFIYLVQHFLPSYIFHFCLFYLEVLTYQGDPIVLPVTELVSGQ